MASGLSNVVLLLLCVTLAHYVSAGSRDCESYTDMQNNYHTSQTCRNGFCCGTCYNRYCCQDSFWRLSEDEQEECRDCGPFHKTQGLYRQATGNGIFLCTTTNIVSRWTGSSHISMIVGFTTLVATFLIFICCCVCPCCCLYKMCRKPRPVVATTTHTTVVTSSAQSYPQQPTAIPGQSQSYQGAQYPPYQPVPVQPGYGPQPMPQGYGAQPMPTSTYQGQPFTPGPPPTYQQAIGPAYSPNPMPYSQAAFNPSQPAYPLQPPVQPNAPGAHTDYVTQPAYNPDYVAPPPKTG